MYCKGEVDKQQRKNASSGGYNGGGGSGLLGGLIGGAASLAFKGAVGATKLAASGISAGIDYVNQKAAEAQAEAERQAAIAAEVAKEQGRAAFEALKAKRTNRSAKAQAAEFLFCAECGTKLEAGSAFCDECGNRL